MGSGLQGTMAEPGEAPLPRATAPDGTLRFLHVDEACLIVDKPAGHHSVPGRGELAANSVAQRVQASFADAMVVHRLDMATSGVMMFGRGTVWQRHFSIEFAQRRIDKHYVALVRGELGSGAGERGEIDLPLAADWPNRPRQKVDHNAGKASLTRWQSIEVDPGRSWTRLLLTPLTGRSHQLRVHLMSIGHPIIGDPLYGPPTNRQSGHRLMLHASSIAFHHPLHGSALRVASAWPF